MAFWSIGPIRGEYQPEDLTETQENDMADLPNIGGVQMIQSKGWKPREVTLSFVVNNLGRDPIPGIPAGVPGAQAVNEGIKQGVAAFTDPELVWARIQEMQRPSSGGTPELVTVVLPGWQGAGATGQRPSKALIVSASIKRTHIAGEALRAVRATISVTLREYSAPGNVNFAQGSAGSFEAARAAAQAASFAEGQAAGTGGGE